MIKSTAVAYSYRGGHACKDWSKMFITKASSSPGETLSGNGEYANPYVPTQAYEEDKVAICNHQTD